MLKAIFTGKVYEEGGDFSIDKLTLPYYPYASFVGVKLPPGDAARGMLLTDKDHKVQVVTVDPEGSVTRVVPPMASLSGKRTRTLPHNSRRRSGVSNARAVSPPMMA